MYYLDTSAIRVIGKDLVRLSQVVKIKISVLGIIEIISRARSSESDYLRCKSTLKTVMDSQLSIDYDMPDKVLLSGFDYINDRCNFKEFRVDCLNSVLKILLDSGDYNTFLTEQKALSVSHPLEYFEIYDQSFGEGFSESFDKETQIIKEAFRLVKEGKAENQIVPKEIIEGSFQNFCEWFMDEQELINESVTVNGLAQRGMKELAEAGLLVEDVGLIHDSYNGCISAFVSAASRLTMYVHKNGGRPGRNDPLDLAHFLYIKEGDFLVSKDRKMLELSRLISCPCSEPESFRDRFLK